MLTAEEQAIADQGRCIEQVWSGTQAKPRPRSREIAGYLGWSGYCGRKATKNNRCKEHAHR